MAKYIGKRIVPLPCGEWDKKKDYEMLSVVLDTTSGDSYIARRSVPSGTAITDTVYWVKSSEWSQQIKNYSDQLTETLKAVREDNAETKAAMSEELAETKTAMSKELSSTKNTMSSRVSECENVTDTTKSELTARVAAIEARQEANVTASTDANADYAAELVDIRTDKAGETFTSAGAAVRALSAGLAKKIVPARTKTIVGTNDTAKVKLNGAVAECALAHIQGGYCGIVFDVFGKYEDVRNKKYRVVVIGDGSAVNAEVIVMNSISAWGSGNQTYGSVRVSELDFNDGNGYELCVDIDFSESRWSEFLKTATASSELFLCVRKSGGEDQTLHFFLYVYELNESVCVYPRYAAAMADKAINADKALYAAAAGQAEHSKETDHAVSADEAEEAETARWSDNYYETEPDIRLNEEGVFYSPGMDSREHPGEYPYQYHCHKQGLITGSTIEYEGKGFAQRVVFNLILSKTSAYTGNQGYAKRLDGMFSYDELCQRFLDGYAYAYVCEIEQCDDLPEGVQRGAQNQRLLISYYNGGAQVQLVSKESVYSRKLTDERTMRIWKFTISEEDITAMQTAKAANAFRTDWFGIWNTKSYTGDTDVVWSPVWYWQDCAFTDGSQTNAEMADFFEAKYRYWSDFVNHRHLAAKFSATDTRIETLEAEAEESKTTITRLSDSVASAEESVKAMEEISPVVTGICCWGDSLTAGGGWTETLAKLSGLKVYNAGTGGENVKTIMTRQGADAMTVSNITIPAECSPVQIASRADDGGIDTEFGNKALPLLQGGSSHVNPVMIGDVEGTLKWTGSNFYDTTGTWTFTRSAPGEEVVITRPTAIRTAYDLKRNTRKEVMVIFMGQNGGYDDLDDLINKHRLMIDHFKGKEYVVVGMSSGTAQSRAEYETAMQKAFGRRFISLRQYLAHPVYDADGTTIVSCYGMEDAGLEPTADDLTKISAGQVPSSMLTDAVHYQSVTKTVIGRYLYKRMVELGIL